MSRFERSSLASRAICSSCGVSWSRVSGLRLRTFSPAVSALFGGKALADTVSRCDLYAGAAIATAALLIAAGPRLFRRIRFNR
jgi:hypothetical protein